jgi:alpha-beta hydrolase superfamily lysophospholipase
VGAFAWLSLSPLNTAGLAPSASTSAPSESYEDAVAAFQAIRAREDAGVPLHPRCYSQLLTHGEKVDRVIVYFHGLTSCPAQADEMAQKYFDLGYNVLLPRMFGHGEADPLTYSLADLTAEGLVDLANESVDIAQGLGNEVVVLGLSAGGTISSWVSQYRSDVDQSISISPFFGPHVVPTWATHAATNLLLTLPNMMVWWNPLETERPEEMNYAYARYASHALGEVMRMGRIVDSSARTTAPAAASNGMLLNEADVAVSFALAQQVVDAWRSNGADVRLEVLPFARRLPHDLIDPRQSGGDVDMVYDLLLEMMNGASE